MRAKNVFFFLSPLVYFQLLPSLPHTTHTLSHTPALAHLPHLPHLPHFPFSPEPAEFHTQSRQHPTLLIIHPLPRLPHPLLPHIPRPHSAHLQHIPLPLPNRRCETKTQTRQGMTRTPSTLPTQRILLRLTIFFVLEVKWRVSPEKKKRRSFSPRGSSRVGPRSTRSKRDRRFSPWSRCYSRRSLTGRRGARQQRTQKTLPRSRLRPSPPQPGIQRR